jgi:hypothetical protein
MQAQETKRKLEFANLMDRACTAYQVKRLDEATFSLYHNALAKYPIADLNEQLDRHIDSSEFFPKVVDMKPYNAKPHDYDQADRILAYCTPYHSTKNPRGNPHGIFLPDSLTSQRYSESVDDYEVRIGNAMTAAMYPNLGKKTEVKPVSVAERMTYQEWQQQENHNGRQ